MLRFAFSDDVELLLSGDVVHENSTGPAEVLRSHAFAPQYVCGPFCNYATYTHADETAANPTYFGYSLDPDTVFDGWGGSARLSANLTDNLSLLSITAYREYDSSWAADGDLTPASTDLEFVDISHNFFSQEVRLNGEIAGAAFTLGAYYSDQGSAGRSASATL
jgi:iron complex outermembrane receptor protein